MATSSKIRVGIVGLSPNRGFASIAHIPALRALPEFEITAVCTTRQESAEATARHFGIPLAFSDPEKLAQHLAVDLVTVAVKVPDHYWPVLAAIDAGKHVYCEWPLGRNTDEAQRMLEAAERSGVRHAVGLQGQLSPTINYVKELVARGYVGRVLTATLIGCAPNWGATLDRSYQADFANGANLMTITGGHQIDALCYCLGEFHEVSAFAVSQRDRIVTEDNGEVPLTSPDQLVVNGVLGNGAVVSFPNPRRHGTRHRVSVRDPRQRRRSRARFDHRRLDATPGTVASRRARQKRQAGCAADPDEIPLCAGRGAVELALQRRPALCEAGREHPQRHSCQPRFRCSREATPTRRRDRPRLKDRAEADPQLTRSAAWVWTHRRREQRLQHECRELAANFATRSVAHDSGVISRHRQRTQEVERGHSATVRLSR
jgi:predicted dehydrogenase